MGESWHRPYETVMANTVGTLNLLQSIVDWGLELEKFDTAGTSEEYGNVHEAVAHHHDFDDAGGLILHERSPLNPKSIYATAKVAADFLTMNYHDGFGVPGVVTRMFNNYGPRQNPRYVTGTIITQALTRPQVELGALEPLRDFCFCTDGVRGHLTVAAHGVPGDVYVYGQGKNISMADWSDLILRVGRERGYWGDDREIVTTPARLRPGATDVMALRVGYEKLHGETGWEPLVSWEEGVLQTIAWYAENRDRWIGRVDWLTADERAARSVTTFVATSSSTRAASCTEPTPRTAPKGSRKYRRHWETEARPRITFRSRDCGDASSGACRPGRADGEDLAPRGIAYPRREALENRGLEIGAGYGRIPLYLANSRLGSPGRTICAVDIVGEHAAASCSGTKRAVRPEPRGEPLSDLRFGGLAADRERLRRALAVTSAVFLHMGKGFVERAVVGRLRAVLEAGRPISSSTSSVPQPSRNPASFHFSAREDLLPADAAAELRRRRSLRRRARGRRLLLAVERPGGE